MRPFYYITEFVIALKDSVALKYVCAAGVNTNEGKT